MTGPLMVHPSAVLADFGACDGGIIPAELGSVLQVVGAFAVTFVVVLGLVVLIDQGLQGLERRRRSRGDS